MCRLGRATHPSLGGPPLPITCHTSRSSSSPTFPLSNRFSQLTGGQGTTLLPQWPVVIPMLPPPLHGLPRQAQSSAMPTPLPDGPFPERSPRCMLKASVEYMSRACCSKTKRSLGSLVPGRSSLHSPLPWKLIALGSINQDPLFVASAVGGTGERRGAREAGVWASVPSCQSTVGRVAPHTVALPLLPSLPPPPSSAFFPPPPSLPLSHNCSAQMFPIPGVPLHPRTPVGSHSVKLPCPHETLSCPQDPELSSFAPFLLPNVSTNSSD